MDTLTFDGGTIDISDTTITLDTKYDSVNSPPHYNCGEIETIDYIVDVLGTRGAADYCHGNVLKYLGSRLHRKNDPVENSKKAQWYLTKMIDLLDDKS